MRPVSDARIPSRKIRRELRFAYFALGAAVLLVAGVVAYIVATRRPHVVEQHVTVVRSGSATPSSAAPSGDRRHSQASTHPRRGVSSTAVSGPRGPETSRAHGAPRPSTRPTSSSGPRPSSSPHPSPTQGGPTSTRPAPRPTHTVTRTATATRTVHPTPTPSPTLPHPIKSIVCGLLPICD